MYDHHDIVAGFELLLIQCCVPCVHVYVNNQQFAELDNNKHWLDGHTNPIIDEESSV